MSKSNLIKKNRCPFAVASGTLKIFDRYNLIANRLLSCGFNISDPPEAARFSASR